MPTKNVRLIAVAVMLLASAKIAVADEDYPRPCTGCEANDVADLWWQNDCDHGEANCAWINSCTVTGLNQYTTSQEE